MKSTHKKKRGGGEVRRKKQVVPIQYGEEGLFSAVPGPFSYFVSTFCTFYVLCNWSPYFSIDVAVDYTCSSVS